MKIISILFLTLMLLSNSACMHRDTLQGNVLNQDDIWLIQEGDTKFHVETLLGTAAINDTLHPNRVQYVEQVKKHDPDISYTRGIIIDYDDALRVKHITRFGFKK